MSQLQGPVRTYIDPVLSDNTHSNIATIVPSEEAC